MYARKQLDFSYRDLLSAVGYALRPGIRFQPVESDLESLWSREDNAVVALSVRTAFDAYLSMLNLPRGSEVVMTGINIPDMVQIVNEHGLTIVPVDLDMRTLEVKPAALNKAITSNTRLIVAAHLFGARMDMGPVFKAVERRDDIRVVEDCAQAFRGITNTPATSAVTSACSVLAPSKPPVRLVARWRGYWIQKCVKP